MLSSHIDFPREGVDTLFFRLTVERNIPQRHTYTTTLCHYETSRGP